MKYIKKMQQVNLEKMIEQYHENPQSLVTEAENRYDVEIASVCDEILNMQRHIILLTGPSGSGKTTTAIKILEELVARGKTVFRISLDNFYKNEHDLPYWSDGCRNYESIEAMDVEFFNAKIRELKTKGKAQFPLYNFPSNSRLEETFPVTFDDETILIFEGINALNPALCEHLNGDDIIRIYVSVHSDFVSNNGDIIIKARNLRLMRRLIRDFSHREVSVAETLDLWVYVLRGEKIYIRPYRKLADIHINSTHNYEPLVYCDDIERLLAEYEDSNEKNELVETLFNIVRDLPVIPDGLIPRNSLIQEFL